jgi:hypothetical protein
MFRVTITNVLLIGIAFCGKINDFRVCVSFLRVSYTVVTFEHSPCHDQVATIAPCEEMLEFSFCETRPGEGVQFHEPFEDLVSLISSKLAPLDDL